MFVRRVSTAVMIAALLAPSAASARAIGPLLTAPGGSPAAETVPASFFGMTFATNPVPTIAVGADGKEGCTSWADIQSARGSGNYNWSLTDSGQQTAIANGVDYLYSFVYRIPSWSQLGACANETAEPSYCPNPKSANYCRSAPINSDLAAFTTALVNRYGHNHIVYELFNEPYDISPTLGKPGDTVTPAQMAAMETTEYNAIRAADPLATIVSQSMTPSTTASYQTYFSQLYAAGAPTAVDAVSMHLYAWGSLVTDGDYPEAIDPITAGTYGAKLNMGNIQGLLNTYGLNTKPLWDTEGSWNDAANRPDFPTAADQAGFVARWYLMHWAMGFRRAYWYQYDNATYGTLKPSDRSDGSSVPQTAYTQVQNWMVGRSMPQPCTWNADHVTWTCGLAGSGGYQALAAWDTSGNESYTPPSPGTYTQYRDLAGNVTPYSGGAVTIGISPILFEN